MYVCLNVCLYVCIHTSRQVEHACAQTYIHIYTCCDSMRACMRVYVLLQMSHLYLSSVRTYIHVSIHACTSVCTYTSPYIYICITHAFKYIRVHTHTHLQRFVYVYIYTYTCSTYVDIHMYVLHTYIRTYKQTYIRMYICIRTDICIYVYRCTDVMRTCR